MTFSQQWVENDFNPYFLFSSEGKIITLNTEAQFLLASVDSSTIFELASSYATSSFGFKTTFFDLDFDNNKFFGIMVGYENEDEIGIKLYQKPRIKFKEPSLDGELVNIYTILDLCISSNSIGNSLNIKKDFDPTFPDVRVNIETIIKLINKSFETVIEKSKDITLKLYIKTGEHIRFDDKKYSIFTIEICSNCKELDFSLVSEVAGLDGIYCEDSSSSIKINLPMIMS